MYARELGGAEEDFRDVASLRSRREAGRGRDKHLLPRPNIPARRSIQDTREPLNAVDDDVVGGIPLFVRLCGEDCGVLPGVGPVAGGISKLRAAVQECLASVAQRLGAFAQHLRGPGGPLYVWTEPVRGAPGVWVSGPPGFHPILHVHPRHAPYE